MRPEKPFARHSRRKDEYIPSGKRVCLVPRTEEPERSGIRTSAEEIIIRQPPVRSGYSTIKLVETKFLRQKSSAPTPSPSLKQST